MSAATRLQERGASVLVNNFIIIHAVCKMEDIQELLYAALKNMNSDEAKQILLEHPELTNTTLTGDFKHEVTTPLIEACKYGR